MTKKTISRRDLIKTSVIAGIGSSLFMGSPLKLFGSSSDALTRVVLVRNENVLDDKLIPDKAILQKMMEDAILTLTSETGIDTAWGKILKTGDVLGVKTNNWNSLSTPEAIHEIITEKALQAGIKKEDIAIDDRHVLSDPVFVRSTALINVRPMRTHYWAGVGSLLKNYIMFADKPSKYHPDSCADLAAIWNLPHVVGKTRLNILVMLTPLFHGVGPHHFNKQFVWKYNGLILGFDPVAVDSVGLRIIEAKRKEYFGEDTPLNPPAKHILLADTRHHLGTADPEKIDLERLGWQQDVLI